MRFTWLVVTLMLLSAAAWGQDDNTPTSRPSVADMRNWVRQLDDPDPDVRTSAAGSIMSLRPDDLPALHKVVMAQSPLSPDQVAALHEAVRDVCLKPDASSNDPSAPALLGLHWPLNFPNDQKSDPGIVVVDRIPGFPAYRLLRSGDVIVGLIDFPNADMHVRRSLIDQVHDMRAGDALRLNILRDGRLIEVDVTLVAMPSDLNELNFEQWLSKRTAAAEQYWHDNFGSLDQDSDQSAATQP